MQRQSRLLYVLVTAVVVVALALWLWEPPDGRMHEGDVLVWSIEADDVRSVTLTRSGETLAIERRGEGWAMTEPVLAEADASEVEYLLVNLARLRGARPLPGVDPTTHGLVPPQATVVLNLNDDSTTTLRIGDEAPTGSGTYAQLADDTVVVLPNSVHDVASVSVEALRERRVLAVPSADVRRVTLTGPNGVLEITGSGADWFVTGFGRANVLRVEDLIFSVRGTRFSSFSPDTAPDGIAEPTYAVEVASADDVWAMAFGEQTPLGVFVRRADGLAGYVDPQSLAWLGQGPLDVVQRGPFRLDPQVDDRIELTRLTETVVLTRTDDVWQGTNDADTLVRTLADAEIVYLEQAVPTPEPARGRVIVERESGRRTEVTLHQADGDAVIAQDVDGGVPFRVRGLQSLFPR